MEFYKLLTVFMISIMSVESSSLLRSENSCSGVYSCANCTAIRLCYPVPRYGYKEYKTVNCTGSTPYCNPVTGTCVSTPTLDCVASGEFTCLKDGSFPHPTTCTKYFTCNNLESHSYDCPQSWYYYDSVSKTCIYNRGCYQFNCNGYNGYKAPYSRDPSIYAYCISGMAKLVDRCIGKYELNVTSQLCEPVCKHEGLIENNDDCSSYFRCDPIPLTSHFSMKLSRCPDGEAFSAEDYQCLPAASVPSCQVAQTTTLSSL